MPVYILHHAYPTIRPEPYDMDSPCPVVKLGSQRILHYNFYSGRLNTSQTGSLPASGYEVSLPHPERTFYLKAGSKIWKQGRKKKFWSGRFALRPVTLFFLSLLFCASSVSEYKRCEQVLVKFSFLLEVKWAGNGWYGMLQRLKCSFPKLTKKNKTVELRRLMKSFSPTGKLGSIRLKQSCVKR